MLLYDDRRGMRAIVHFSLGVSGMLLILSFLDLEYRREFLLMFASGYWALVPDLGWLLLRLGMPGAAILWKTVFNSPIGNLFWFAPLLDAAEPVNRVFEMTSAFLLLGAGIGVYYVTTDWDADATTTAKGR